VSLRRGSVLRILALGGTIITLASVAAMLPLRQLPGLVTHLGPIALVAAVALSVLLLSSLVPRSAISLAMGALFGVLTGTGCALLAAMLAAGVTFAAGRWLGRDFVARHAPARIARFDRWLSGRGLLGVIAVRLPPVAPFGLIGYLCGASGVRPRPYLLGTFLASVLPTFSYATLGSAAMAPGSINALTFVPSVAGWLATAAIAIHFRRTAKKASN
jgi:uncharacterized membrane protein YdjX (TVP38/TMEM64 family)